MVESLKLKKTKGINAAFIIIVIVEGVLCAIDFINESYYSATFANISIIIFSIVYLNIFFKKEIIIDLKFDFAFITIIGIFLSTCLITPIILFGKYFYNVISREKYYLIASIGPLASLVLYSFLLKAISCIGKTLK